MTNDLFRADSASNAVAEECPPVCRAKFYDSQSGPAHSVILGGRAEDQSG